MLKLEAALLDENDGVLYPPRLLKAIILNNPFAAIIPTIIVLENEEVKDSSKTETVAVKDFNLLSFGEEAEEDNEESVILTVEPPELAIEKRKENRSSNWESDDEVKAKEELEVIKKEKELVYCLHYKYVMESRNFYFYIYIFRAMKERIKNKLRDTNKEPKKVENYKINDVEDDKDIKGNE
ncbi:Peptidyl-prolyl isomerase cwc27 [Eufriesea mexicana]|uniref:Peptidyl-prolyl isomerase cwc27 n=1 Tax=Eufriesea mexicana TaxID=516756 RepID=A0A310S9S2_9HYME|nr:Peptidyl-prolyl isomerase cwc27 [Eufriesea mexicana]